MAENTTKTANDIDNLDLEQSLIKDYQEYYLMINYFIYKIIIQKTNNNININIKNYKIIFNSNELSLLSNNKFKTIDDAYEFIIKNFEENKVFINKIYLNKKIVLLFHITEENKFELELLYNKENKNIIIDEINNLKKEINELRIQNDKLQKEINGLKIIDKYKVNKNKVIKDPKNLKLFPEITNNSYATTNFDNTFVIFKSINEILYLIYATKIKSIICYDLNNQNIIKKIKNSHNEYITNFRHYLDNMNNRDLVMSISHNDNNIKIWNASNWECIVNIPNINSNGVLYSGCFLTQNNNIYIITSNCNHGGDTEPIKVFDLHGYKIKNIKDSDDKISFIDSYYDNINNKNYIITGNNNKIKSYDYDINQLYNIYYDLDNGSHRSIIMHNDNNILKMIESSKDGYIRIWNFHYGALLDKIKVSDYMLYGICLWDNNYLFAGCDDKTIKLVELKTGLVIKSFNGHNESVLTIRKINLDQYGECLISQGYKKDQIKLWINLE